MRYVDKNRSAKRLRIFTDKRRRKNFRNSEPSYGPLASSAAECKALDFSLHYSTLIATMIKKKALLNTAISSFEVGQFYISSNNTIS